MTTALVTGSHGWVGTYLRPLLRAKGYQVIGVGRRVQSPADGEGYFCADLRDAEAVSTVIEKSRPDVVFHLAAAVPQRVTDVNQLVADNVLTTYHLGTALRRDAVARSHTPRLVVAGSSAQYGLVPVEVNPVSEQTLPRPADAYGHAKMAAESVALSLAADGVISIVAARPFNHVGPGEPGSTVAGAFARRMASVLTGQSSRVQAGDLSAVRDFTDVRDVARAYLALAETAVSGEVVNVCSGRGVQMRTVLEHLLHAAGLDWSIVEVVAGAGRVRHQVGSPERIRSLTGWSAQIPLQRSLTDLLADVLAPLGRDGSTA